METITLACAGKRTNVQKRRHWPIGSAQHRQPDGRAPSISWQKSGNAVVAPNRQTGRTGARNEGAASATLASGVSPECVTLL